MRNLTLLIVLVLCALLVYFIATDNWNRSMIVSDEKAEDVVSQSVNAVVKDYRGNDIEYVYAFDDFEREFTLPDSNTFEYLLTESGANTTLYKDKDNVYMTSQESGSVQVLTYIKDVSSFELLGYITHECEPEYDSFGCEEAWPTKVIYAKDIFNVYAFAGIAGPPEVLAEADVSSFEVIQTDKGQISVYAQDKNSVYFGSQIIAADVSTFVAESVSVGVDADGMYYNGILQ